MAFTESRPMRARGLKHSSINKFSQTSPVAPHAGAWIETAGILIARSPDAVAPHAGAWIETFNR